MNSLRDAASFLTRLPLHRSNFDGATTTMSAAVPWFAVVGLALGALQAAAYVGMLELIAPLPAAAIAVAALALITGAFHHDGLADMADAFGGGWTVERRLEIMKDSRLGTYGVVTLALALIVEISTIATLAGTTAAAALIIAHSLSRSVAASMMLTTEPAQDSGLGVDYLAALSRPAVIVSGLVAAVIAIALLQLAAVAAVISAYVAGALVVMLAVRKIGGISGDVLGAVQQLAKIAALVAIMTVTS